MGRRGGIPLAHRFLFRGPLFRANTLAILLAVGLLGGTEFLVKVGLFPSPDGPKQDGEEIHGVRKGHEGNEAIREAKCLRWCVGGL